MVLNFMEPVSSSIMQMTDMAFRLQIFKTLKSFRFSMPSGWNDRDLAVFICVCKKSMSILKSRDENIKWGRIARSCLKRSNNITQYTVNSCMELALALKSYVIHNERFLNDVEHFRLFMRDMCDILPFFPEPYASMSIPNNESEALALEPSRALAEPSSSKDCKDDINNDNEGNNTCNEGSFGPDASEMSVKDESKKLNAKQPISSEKAGTDSFSALESPKTSKLRRKRLVSRAVTKRSKVRIPDTLNCKGEEGVNFPTKKNQKQSKTVKKVEESSISDTVCSTALELLPACSHSAGNSSLTHGNSKVTKLRRKRKYSSTSPERVLPPRGIRKNIDNLQYSRPEEPFFRGFDEDDTIEMAYLHKILKIHADMATVNPSLALLDPKMQPVVRLHRLTESDIEKEKNNLKRGSKKPLQSVQARCCGSKEEEEDCTLPRRENRIKGRTHLKYPLTIKNSSPKRKNKIDNMRGKKYSLSVRERVLPSRKKANISDSPDCRKSVEVEVHLTKNKKPTKIVQNEKIDLAKTNVASLAAAGSSAAVGSSAAPCSSAAAGCSAEAAALLGQPSTSFGSSAACESRIVPFQQLHDDKPYWYDAMLNNARERDAVIMQKVSELQQAILTREYMYIDFFKDILNTYL